MTVEELIEQLRKKLFTVGRMDAEIMIALPDQDPPGCYYVLRAVTIEDDKIALEGEV